METLGALGASEDSSYTWRVSHQDQRMREAQLSRRAELAGRSVQQFSAGVRSLKERRAAAKRPVLNKGAQH